MSDMDEDERREINYEARRLLLEAVETWQAQYPEWEGSIITGYVFGVELTRPGEDPFVTWLTGNGIKPTEHDNGGLVRHRVDGLLSAILRDIRYDVRGVT